MRFDKKNFFYNAGVVLFMTSSAFILMAARYAAPSRAAAEGSDSEFAMKAASGGMAEVQMGKLAVERGTNPAVKKFGQRMVDDHSKADDELKNAASRSSLTLPTDMGKAEADTYARLSKLSGKQFDMAYAKEMVKDHEKDVAEFQKESMSGKNPEVKEFAAKTLPTLQSHLQEARAMEKSVMSASSSSGM